MILRAHDILVRCVQRGYEWSEIQPCLTKDLGGGWFDVDVDHPAYPKSAKPGHSAPPKLGDEVSRRLSALNFPSPQPIPPGPGTELKKLLGRLGIKASSNCACNQRAKAMDANGIQWCEENIETICDWLAEESAKRKLPFIRSAGKLLIRMAIRNAKKGNSQ